MALHGLAAASAVLLWSMPARAWEPQDDYPMSVHRLEIETADRIKSHILDPILGHGRGYAFVELDIDVKREREVKDKIGVGVARRTARKCDARKNCPPVSPWIPGTGPGAGGCEEEDLFRGFGFGGGDATCRPEARAETPEAVKTSTDTAKPSPGYDRDEGKSGSFRAQESRQAMSLEEQRTSATLIFNNFTVLVVHDARVSPARLRMIRETIHQAYERKLPRDQIRFHGADFVKDTAR